MNNIKVLQKHIQTISKYQKSDLHNDIDKFISENQDLNDVELLDKIYLIYGTRIKLLENATQCKAIINIKEWVATFGFFFIFGLAVWLVATIILSMGK